MTTRATKLLNRLEKLKTRFGSSDANLVDALTRIRREKFADPQSLARLHECLLFLRAYPPSARIARITESLLATFSRRIEELNDDADLSALQTPELSGIDGTVVTDTFSYYIVRWLVNGHPSQVAFEWQWFEDENRLAEGWPRFMPLLEEDALVEANVPYVSWLRAARNGKREVDWIIQQFERLPLTDTQKAELYDALQLYVRWAPPVQATRTRMRLPRRNLFFHRTPLIPRRDVSLRDELAQPAPPLQQLPAARGLKILDMARATSTIRYRELHGFTHGDPQRVLWSELGRGVDLFIMGVSPDKRLPLRAYHAALIFKNEVPVGYFEGLSLFERMESGFNFYYTFREGETAWIYARTLNVFRHLLGINAFSIDPYQIGYQNEEGIESGAFWFYRKLGFRPTRPDILRITKNEEERIAARRSYRTSMHILRQLAAGPMILELDQTRAGDWDRFAVRTIGLAVQRRLAKAYSGNAAKMREASIRLVINRLGIRVRSWSEVQMSVLSDLAVMLSLIRDLGDWGEQEKQQLGRIVRAKAEAEERSYLRLMQAHDRLRAAVLDIGSS